jgi:hypothetical protein
MYIRVSRGRIDPARFDEINPVLPDIVAAIKRLPGNESCVTGLDLSNGQNITVSTWDTEEHARFSRDALSDFIRRLQALSVQLDPPEFFEATAY